MVEGADGKCLLVVLATFDNTDTTSSSTDTDTRIGIGPLLIFYSQTFVYL